MIEAKANEIVIFVYDKKKKIWVEPIFRYDPFVEKGSGKKIFIALTEGGKYEDISEFKIKIWVNRVRVSKNGNTYMAKKRRGEL